MIPSGAYNSTTRTLTVRRTFTASIDDVWAGITESDRLARWYGTWTGDPSTGSVMVTMNAEASEFEPVRHDIIACEPPRLLSVEAGDDAGSWHLSFELFSRDSGTELVLSQRDLGPDRVGDIGPGWEWYLDRLVAAFAGTEPPTLHDFEVDYMAMKAAYE